MKNLFVGFLLAFAAVTSLSAQDAPAPNAAPAQTAIQTSSADEQWTPFQIGFFPRFPSYTHNSAVYGIKSGWPICSGIGSVNGLEASWLYSGTEHIKGFQASWLVNDSKNLIGLQATWIVNLNNGTLEGVQASCITNVAGDLTGLQAGGFNYAKSINGFQPGVLGNVVAGEFNGFQTGLFSSCGNLNGFQFSGVNVAKETNGCQIGFVNVAKKKGFQLGLVNVIQDGWIPFMPFINFSF